MTTYSTLNPVPQLVDKVKLDSVIILLCNCHPDCVLSARVKSSQTSKISYMSSVNTLISTHTYVVHIVGLTYHDFLLNEYY